MRVTWKKNIKEISHENNIFIKNIPLSTTQECNYLTLELEKLFSQFGPVFSCKISFDQDGVSRGYGYVQYEKKESAHNCLS